MFATLVVTSLLALAQDGPAAGAARSDDPIAAARDAVDAAAAAQSTRDFDAARTALHSAFDRLAGAPAFDAIGAANGDPIDPLLAAIARRAHEVNDLALARTAGEARVRRLETGRDAGDSELRDAWQSLGITLWQSGDLVAARARFESSIAAIVTALGEDPAELVPPRQGLALVLKDQGDVAGARAIEERVLERLEATLPADSRDVQRARRNLAVTLGRLGDDAGALRLEEKVLASFERTVSDDDPDLRTARMNLAVTRFGRGDVAGARDLFERVVRAFEATVPDDSFELQVARQNLAIALRVSGEPGPACALMEKVVGVLERTRPADDAQLQASRNNLGAVLYQLGRPAEARRLQERVLEVRERILPPDHRDLQFVRQNLAITLKALGDLHAARKLEEQVLASFERTLPAEHADVVGARANLAATIADLGDAPGARLLQERVLAAREGKLDDGDPLLVAARTNLATTLKRTGEPARARALEERALAALAAARDADDADLLLVRGNLAVTLKLLGDVEGALALEREIVAARERTSPPEDPDLLTARENLAASLGQLGRLDESIAIHEQALAIRERRLPADHPDLAVTRANLAGARLAAGDVEGARVVLVSAVRAARASLRNALEAAPREAAEIVSGWSRTIDLSLHAFDPDDAEARGALFALCETRRHVATAAPACDFSADHDLAALRFATKEARTRLAAELARAPAGGDADPAARLAGFVRARDEADAAVQRVLVAHGAFVAEVEASAVARALARDAAAVGYFTRDEGRSLLAWVVRPNGALVRVDLPAVADVEAAVAAWRDAIDAPADRGARVDAGDARTSVERAAGERLRSLVLDPVLAAAGDARVLHICPDGVLHLVPLDALPLAGGRVGDRHRVVVETSFARLVAARAGPAGRARLLVVGDVAFGSIGPSGPATPSAPVAARESVADRGPRFPPLLQTRFEAEAVERLFAERFESPGELLVGTQATADSFAERVAGARYVHVATHGWISPGADPRLEGLAPFALCGLAFAGANSADASGLRAPGIETAEEIAALDLSACSIAVLSACETNVGTRAAGLGIRSLMAAVHAAGARAAVSSLWRVDDAATRRLMEEFYGGLWRDRLPVAEALWRAKRSLADSGHPTRDWAGFVQSGDPAAD